MFFLVIHSLYLEALKQTWCSSIYSFFKLDDVSVQYHNGRLCHFFPCAAWRCKTAARGVHHFQDSKDCASTGNLQHHALQCFGEEAVHNGMKGANIDGTSGSIFESFARQGQKPVHYSHWSHTNTEVWYGTPLLPWPVNWLFFSAHLVKWITENNQPVNIVNDRELHELLTAGRPWIELPGHATVFQDIKACFSKCRDRVAKL